MPLVFNLTANKVSVFEDSDLQKPLEEFTKSEISSENYYFLKDLFDLYNKDLENSLSKEEMHKELTNIYNKYIPANATPVQINLPSDISNDLIRKKESGGKFELNDFKKAFKNISDLMQRDTVPRFIKHQTHTDYLAKNEKNKKELMGKLNNIHEKLAKSSGPLQIYLDIQAIINTASLKLQEENSKATFIKEKMIYDLIELYDPDHPKSQISKKILEILKDFKFDTGKKNLNKEIQNHQKINEMRPKFNSKMKRVLDVLKAIDNLDVKALVISFENNLNTHLNLKQMKYREEQIKNELIELYLDTKDDKLKVELKKALQQLGITDKALANLGLAEKVKRTSTLTKKGSIKESTVPNAPKSPTAGSRPGTPPREETKSLEEARTTDLARKRARSRTVIDVPIPGKTSDDSINTTEPASPSELAQRIFRGSIPSRLSKPDSQTLKQSQMPPSTTVQSSSAERAGPKKQESSSNETDTSPKVETMTEEEMRALGIEPITPVTSTAPVDTPTATLQERVEDLKKSAAELQEQGDIDWDNITTRRPSKSFSEPKQVERSSYKPKLPPIPEEEEPTPTSDKPKPRTPRN